MAERGILFGAPMVRAHLAGTKTQTRRAWREQPAPGVRIAASVNGKTACPYGQPGDRLWVRETYIAWGRWETRFNAKKGRDEWHFVDMTLDAGKWYGYVADGDWPWPFAGKRRLAGATPTWWTRPAIFMPRAASRITLEITGVRAERLQDISEADAIAEGIEQMPGPEPYPMWRHYGRPGTRISCPIESYRSLWESINGATSWDANPWVWVVAFTRVRDTRSST